MVPVNFYRTTARNGEYFLIWITPGHKSSSLPLLLPARSRKELPEPRTNRSLDGASSPPHGSLDRSGVKIDENDISRDIRAP